MAIPEVTNNITPLARPVRTAPMEIATLISFTRNDGIVAAIARNVSDEGYPPPAGNPVCLQRGGWGAKVIKTHPAGRVIF